MPHMSDQQLQIKDINNILELLIEEYSNITYKNSINILKKEINELLELLQTIELDQYLTVREKTIKSYDFFQLQLAVILERLGCNRNGASIG
ncbi:14055_t:CDS:2 [Cetraspora pellucida]|uniref:14055_t:CDS:1 n=1 Tax=Cetraspora pellucida TaxID=1433469 RepID=A0A9N9NC03_9GLOM|nr:14055_t:CDS:2 [Cetraspora pellucida]